MLLYYSRCSDAPFDKLALKHGKTGETVWEMKGPCACGLQWVVSDSPGKERTVILADDTTFIDNMTGEYFVEETGLDAFGHEDIVWRKDAQAFATFTGRPESEGVTVYDLKSHNYQVYLDGYFVDDVRWLDNRKMETDVSQEYERDFDSKGKLRLKSVDTYIVDTTSGKVTKKGAL